MNRSIITSIIMLTMIFNFTVKVNANEIDSSKELNIFEETKSAILIERDTGRILLDKNAHEKLPPASMTKVMTLLLIMEALDRGELMLDEKIRVSERAASMGGSQIFLAEGEEMSVEDLLKGIAIASGNDASVALAERIAGSEEAFVEMMNEKVTQLNLKNTLFQNSSGLPAKDHYSTSYDIAIISKELLKYETVTDYTSIYEDYLRKGEENEFWLVNTNKLVRFYPGVDGLKTGYTNEAKYCLTATAKKDDMRVIAVVMGADTVKKRNATISKMLDYAFNHFDTKVLYTSGETITSVKNIKAKKSNINITVGESVSTLHKKGESTEDIQKNVKINSKFNFPLAKGEQVGLLTIKQADKVISEVPLIVDEEIKSASYMTLLKRSIQNLVKFN